MSRPISSLFVPIVSSGCRSNCSPSGRTRCTTVWELNELAMRMFQRKVAEAWRFGATVSTTT
eukprot:1810949-Amphidinium_carterae.1